MRRDERAIELSARLERKRLWKLLGAELRAQKQKPVKKPPVVSNLTRS